MNKTFKTNSQIIEIEATATEIINTKVVFWSHDKGTARLKISIKKRRSSLSLTEGTIVPICLLFKSNTAADGIGRHIYNATIDDAVNGLISFILPDNILGYQGIVDGSIYIDMPNKQSLDTAGRFTFNIRRSPIDYMIPELEDYYYAGFNAVDQRIKDTLAKIETIETDFIKEMNAMQSKLNKFESDSKVQIDNIQQQITDKNLYTKKETDDKFVPKTQTATATQAGIAKVTSSFLFDDLTALSSYGGKLLYDKIDNIIRILPTGKPAIDPPATYKPGITVFDGRDNAGYPISYSTVVTIMVNVNRIFQITFPKSMENANSDVTKLYIRGLSAADQTQWGVWETFLTSRSVVHNLTTTATDLPLSAGMGKLLKDSMVNIVDNQIIGGIKNFTSMPKLNGVDLIEDTGWVDVPYDDDWESYGTSPDNRLKIRRVGKEVMLTGTIKAKKTISASGNLTTRVWVSKVLPDQFKIPPGVYCGNLQQSSGNNMVYQSVDNATNKVYFERNRNGAGSPLDYNEGYWYPVNLRWLVN